MCHFPSRLPPEGLKHVSDEKKTHKNPNLRSHATATKTKSPGTVNSPRAAVQKKKPLLELEGKKWRVVCEMSTFSLTDNSQIWWKFLFYQLNCSIVVAGELWAETRPGDWGDGAQTSGLRFWLQQLHTADKGKDKLHHHRWADGR